MSASKYSEYYPTFFKLDNALRIALKSESRPQAALYFCRLLREAAMIYMPGDYVKRSVGLEWLSDNHERFHELVPDATLFFQSFLDEELCAVHMIHDPKLMELIALEHRAPYIRAVIERHPPTSIAWLYSVKKTELRVGEQASLLLDLIKIAMRRPSAMRSYLIDAFLRDGVDGGRMWQLLDAEQFYEAVHACTTVNAGLLFSEAAQLLPLIAQRVTAEQYEEIRSCAGKFVCDLRNVSLNSLKMFPVDVQLRAVACSTALPRDIMEHIATLPGGSEAILAYEQYAGQVSDVELAQKMAKTVIRDTDVLTELLGTSRYIETISVKLPVL